MFSPVSFHLKVQVTKMVKMRVGIFTYEEMGIYRH